MRRTLAILAALLMVSTVSGQELDWAQIKSFPGACSAGDFVSQIDDTLTCGTPTDTDTSASTECAGTTTYLDGEGNCDTLNGLEDFETATDDAVPVGNGATFDSKVLTDCDGATDGVTYDVTSNAFGCNTLGAHTTDTGPSPDCSGSLTYQDGEGNCDAYTLSGSTTSLGTTSGTLTSGDCAEFDASGNLVAAGAACAAGGGTDRAVHGWYLNLARSNITNASWTRLDNLTIHGTTALGFTPSTGEMVTWASGTGATFSLRLYDNTAGAAIATITGITGSAAGYSIGTIANWPSSSTSDVQLQVIRTAGSSSNAFAISSASIYGE